MNAESNFPSARWGDLRPAPCGGELRFLFLSDGLRRRWFSGRWLLLGLRLLWLRLVFLRHLLRRLLQMLLLYRLLGGSTGFWLRRWLLVPLLHLRVLCCWGSSC